MMDTHLKQKLGIALGVLAVIVLTVIALASLIGDESQTPTDPQLPDPNPAGATSANPRNGAITFQDGDTSFTALCRAASTTEPNFSIVIANLGSAARDFAVEVRLIDSAGSSVAGVADVTRLGAGEQREIAVASEIPVVPPALCSITAVETDRQVIRVN